MRLSPLARNLAAAVWLLSALAPARAQDPPGPEGVFGESVAVDLMTVQVLAVDAKGNVVRDLGRDDFRLFDSGKLVELTHFEPPRGGASEEAAGAVDDDAAEDIGAEPP